MRFFFFFESIFEVVLSLRNDLDGVRLLAFSGKISKKGAKFPT